MPQTLKGQAFTFREDNMTCSICGADNAEHVHYEARNLCPDCNIWREVLSDRYMTSDEFSRRWNDEHKHDD